MIKNFINKDISENSNENDKTNDISYKYLPVSVFDVKPSGKKGIRGKQHHDKKSSRATYSPFPQDIAEWCAEYHLRDNQIIFDPFAGWGERHNAIKNANKTTKTSETKKNFGIVIHGGAGTILKENMSDSLEEAYRQKLKQAITEGHSILKNGGTSMQAVTKTINIRQSTQYF